MNQTSQKKQSPLSKAITENRVDVVSFLLENGMEPTYDDLKNAVVNDHAEIVEKLLPFDLQQEHAEDNTLLHLVKSKAVAELLANADYSVDVKNKVGKYPYETVRDQGAADYLKEKYFTLHPVTLQRLVSEEESPEEEVNRKNLSWGERFRTETVSMQDLKPVDYRTATGQFKIEHNGEVFKITPRFLSSLARKYRFSSNIFNYFTGEEVFTRILERNPETRFKITFDQEQMKALGVVDADKKILPVSIACDVISSDPRVSSMVYGSGVISTRLNMNEGFGISRDSKYRRLMTLNYPVDGVGMPMIYLGFERQICANGAVAMVNQFRTEIEVSDQHGTHLSRMLRSFSNEAGFQALEDRVRSAQETRASVRELMDLQDLVGRQVTDTVSASRLRYRLEEMAGDPCSRYGTTALSNIQKKRRSLLPVDCSVNDLINFSSELTTHFGDQVRDRSAFDMAMGEMLAQEFDLENMYSYRGQARAFHIRGTNAEDLLQRHAPMNGRRVFDVAV